MKNKFYIIAVVALISAMLIGCAAATGGGSDSIGNALVAKQVQPIMKWTGVSGGARSVVASSRNVMYNVSTPTTTTFDDFVLGTDLDPSHVVATSTADYTDFTVRLSAPMFSGFKLDATNADGDVHESIAYNRKLTTTTHIDEATGSVTYDGRYNDGGGYYKLTINSDNNYTFEHYLIMDVAVVNSEDDSVHHDGMLDSLRRYVIVSKASGKLYLDANNNVCSDGESHSVFFTIITTVSGRTYYKDGVCTANIVGGFQTADYDFVYDNYTKSRSNVFAIRNINKDRECYEWYDTTQKGYCSSAFIQNITYSNPDVYNKVWNMDSFSEAVERTDVSLYASVPNNFVQYKVDGVWSGLYEKEFDWSTMYNIPSDAWHTVSSMAALDALWNQY